jgi:hypothetical protein
MKALPSLHMLLKLLKRWLGWDPDSGLLDFSDLSQRPRPNVVKPSPPVTVRPPAETPAPAHAERRAKPERTPMDVLDNPRLTLDKPGDDGFDPYNTGAFNRSASWEKIGRQRKR